MGLRIDSKIEVRNYLDLQLNLHKTHNLERHFPRLLLIAAYGQILHNLLLLNQDNNRLDNYH